MRSRTFLFVLGVVLGAAFHAAPRAAQTNPFLGQWNITGVGADNARVYWLELKEEDGRLSGLFLNQTGHPLPLAVVKIDGDTLLFQGGTSGTPSGPEYRAKLEDGRLIGSHVITVRGTRGEGGAQNPPTTRTVNWIGMRPPVWPAANANGKHTYGTPVTIFDGSTRSRPLDAVFGIQFMNRPMNWEVDGDLLTNIVPGGNNLVTRERFKDFKVTLDYKLAAKSNSGLYLRGRYELQILDDLADTTTEPFLTQAAIYGRRAPDVKASKAPGEWQTLEAVMVANRVTVTLNGKIVHNNQPVIGVTGGALDNDELTPGPIMIQGDHEKVWIKRLVVTPIVTPGK